MTIGRQVVLEQFKSPLQLHEFEIGRPGPDEILIRVNMAGVCGSDVHTWKGEIPRNLPIVLGHEGIGTIDALGTDIREDYAGTPVKLGDRVYWSPARACHRCHACAVERDPSACERKILYGPTGWGNGNSYADAALLKPEMPFFKIPDDTPSDAVIAFGCAMPTVLQAIDRMGPLRASSSVVVLGCGPVGLAAILMAHVSGCDPIVAVERVDSRLALARHLGATHTVSTGTMADDAPAEHVRQLCGGRGADVVIEATGNVKAFPQGLAMVGRGGRYLIVGLWAGEDTATIDPHHILRNNVRIVGSAYAGPDHYFKAIRIAQQHHREMKLEQIVTSRFGLAEAMQGLEAIQRGKPGKAILLPDL